MDKSQELLAEARLLRARMRFSGMEAENKHRQEKCSLPPLYSLADFKEVIAEEEIGEIALSELLGARVGMVRF